MNDSIIFFVEFTTSIYDDNDNLVIIGRETRAISAYDRDDCYDCADCHAIYTDRVFAKTRNVSTYTDFKIV